MGPTRIDTQQLAKAVRQADVKLDEVIEILSKYLVLLTPEERQTAPKPPETFPPAGRSLARAVIAHPQIAAGTGHDPKAVLEDLDNIEILGPIEEKAARVAQLVADSRLQWMSEAYSPSLRYYGVAKVIAKNDAKVQEVVDALSDVFAARRQRKPPTQK